MSLYKNVLAATVVLCLVAGAVGQQPGEQSYEDVSKMPDGAQGEYIKSLISAINSNDPDNFKKFLTDSCTQEFYDAVPMQQHVSIFSNFCRQTGGVDFHSVRKYVPEQENRLVIIVKDRLFENWRGVVLMLDPNNDGKVAGIQLMPARTPTNVKPEVMSEKECLEKVGATLERLVKADAFSGTVLIAKGDQVLLQFACGEASKRFHVKNNIDTKFNLGSMNKMFTSVAINQLVEQKKLSLDDTIDKYVDESWLPKEMTEKIQVRHLLAHTSGLGSYFNQEFMSGSRAGYRNIDDFKPLVKGESLAFAPGARFQYSNTGMLLLGVVIEQASGQDYFEYIRENVYQPLEMNNSDSYEMDQPVENLAIGYIPDPDSAQGFRNNVFQHVIKGGPAGGGFSTVGDLHKFGVALLNNKLLNAGTQKEMWTSQSNSSYGFGFSIDENEQAGLVVGHGGGFPGLNGNLDVFVDAGYVVAVLSNYDQGASGVAGYIKQQLAGVIAGKE